MKKAIMKVMKDDVVVEEIVGGYVGVSKDGEETILMLEGGAEARFMKDDDHWLEMTDEVWELPKGKVVTKAIEAKTPTKNEGEPKELKDGSNHKIVYDVCKANPSLGRKEMMAKIKEALPNKSDGFISTYHNTAMKRIKAEVEAARKAKAEQKAE